MRKPLPYRPIDDLPDLPGSAFLIMAGVEPELWSALWEELDKELRRCNAPPHEQFVHLLERARRRVRRRENGYKEVALPLEEVRPSTWASPATVEALAVDRLFCRWLLAYLRRQHPMMSRVVRLRLQGYTQAEIAERLGISRQYVSKLLKQMRKTVREWLDA
jgi:CRP-like cAMP-binding protein